MSLTLLAAGATLAAFAAVTTTLALAALAIARFLPEGHPVATARRLFLLRVLPAGAGAMASLAVALPGFVMSEPRGLYEVPGWTFLLLAGVGAAALADGLVRVSSDTLRTSRLRRSWLQKATRVSLEGAAAPALRMAHPFPVVCVVGVLRPRILVAESVLRGLSARELRAVLEHESAHLASRDNAKRLLLRLCPFLPVPWAARRLERRWEEASEEAADVRAGGGLDLAAALVATARLAPPGMRYDLGTATFHRGGPLARRLRRLCAPAAPSAPPVASGVALAASGLVLAGLLAAWPHLLRPAHLILEALVHLP